MDCKKGGFYLATLLIIVSAIFLLPAFSPIADDADFSSGTTSVSVNSRSGGVTTIPPTNRPIQIDGVNCTTIISNYHSAQSSLARAQRENTLQSIASIKKYLSDNLWKYNKCMGISSTPTTASVSADFSSACLKLGGTVKASYCVLPSGLVCGEGAVMAGNCPPKPVSEGTKPVACTMDARICPDGSAVGRVGPYCEFAPCPPSTTANGTAVESIGSTQEKPMSAGLCVDLKTAVMVSHSQYWKYVLEGNFSSADQMNSSLLSREKNYLFSCMGIYLYEETIARHIFPCREFLKGKEAIKQEYSDAFRANDTEKTSELAKKMNEGTESYLSCVKEKLGGLTEARETSCEELSRITEEYSKAKDLLYLDEEELKARGLAKHEANAVFQSAEYRLKVAKRYCSLTEDPKEVPNQPIPRIIGGNVTKTATAAEASCGEAKGLGKRVVYLKGLLALPDAELSQKGLTREAVKEKFEDADRAYNTAMYNCAEKRKVTFSPVAVNGPCGEAKELEQRILYIKKILALPESEFLEKFAGKNRTSFEGELSGLSGKYSSLVSECREAQGEQISNNPCGKPAAELLEKYAISVQKMNEARNSGEEARFKELEKSLVDLKKQIASYNKCAESREENPGEERASDAKSISDYYRAQLAKLPGKETGDGLADEIARLTALREEINRRIRALVEKRSAIDARELSGVAKIEISNSGVSVNGENVSDETQGSEVIANIGISEASIVSANGTVSIDDGSDFETTAESPVTIENGRLKLGDKNVSISPGEFSAALRFAPEKVELGKDEKGEPQYVAKGTEERRLFFIIPVNAEIVQRMHAENGTFYGEERPFWAFLSSKVK